MTLCIAWRKNDNIHFASDSRVQLGENKYADVAIKVLSVPYYIYEPDTKKEKGELSFSGELGMCFAGSSVNSLFIKETIEEMLKHLQYAPPYTHKNFSNIAALIFKVYKQISIRVCELMEKQGIAEIIISGKSQDDPNTTRTFKYSTNDKTNEHSCTEILKHNNEHYFSGSGSKLARQLIESIDRPKSNDYLSVLKKIIDDNSIKSVGGNIQYGTFLDNKFTIYGNQEAPRDGENRTHYWRGGIDLNSDEFTEGITDYIISYQYIYQE